LFTPDSASSGASNTRAETASNNYQPVFLDNLLASKNTPEINATCNYIQSCIADVIMSGLTSVGLQTKSNIQTNVQSSAVLSKMKKAFLFSIFLFFSILILFN
jgi:hypothetical protein